jgi:site-specific recombinase XerD
MEIFRRQRVLLPGNVAYWTVVGAEYERIEPFDGFLRTRRLGRGWSEGTTAQYASNLVDFVTWAGAKGYLTDLDAAARELTSFVWHLRQTPVARKGSGAGTPRSEARIDAILVTVRSFYHYAVKIGVASPAVTHVLYDIVEPRRGSMPWAETLPDAVAKPVHRLGRDAESEPVSVTVGEFVSMLAAPALLRDKLLICVLGLGGLRVGEALSLRRSALHFAESSRAIGCPIGGPHLHVIRHEDPAARAVGKSRRPRAVPAHPWTLAVYAMYQSSMTAPEVLASDYVFVNVEGGEIGRQMSDDRARKAVTALANRAGIERHVTPHQFRHGLATELRESGRSLDEIQRILGHAAISSTQRYGRTSQRLVREAIESVALPSAGLGGIR